MGCRVYPVHEAHATCEHRVPCDIGVEDKKCSPSSSFSSTDNFGWGRSTVEQLPVTRKKKSKKRCAAEEKLEKSAKRRSALDLRLQSRLYVDTCSDSVCQSKNGSEGGTDSASGNAWCGMQVAVPALDWPSLFKHDGIEGNSKENNGLLPDIFDVILVEKVEDVGPALQTLRRKMVDRVVAIDLEWRPDNKWTNNKVALIQLASDTCCLLLRCCNWGRSLPQPLIQFFGDPEVSFVSFSWDTSDEEKMQSTFGHGRKMFSDFVDLQEVGSTLGYPGYGLAQMAQLVLGCEFKKDKRVSRSDWQRKSLQPGQIRYAALDALVTGHIFRCLRAWHASPSACVGCSRPLGTYQVRFQCLIFLEKYQMPVDSDDSSCLMLHAETN